MRRALVLFFALLSATCALAQAPATAGSREPLDARRNQKVERLQHEDSGSRIDEVRYAGQTERITVQPKADVPAYEVETPSMARTRPTDPREGTGAGGGGQRFWNVLRF